MQVNLTRLLSNSYVRFVIYLFSPMTNIFILPIVYLIKRICWEVYLLFTRLPPTQAWMDPREQTLMIKYIEELKRTRG